MMELADMRDLGSRAERRAGSTPVTRTKSASADFLEKSNRHDLLFILPVWWNGRHGGLKIL